MGIGFGNKTIKGKRKKSEFEKFFLTENSPEELQKTLESNEELFFTNGELNLRKCYTFFIEHTDRLDVADYPTPKVECSYVDNVFNPGIRLIEVKYQEDIYLAVYPLLSVFGGDEIKMRNLVIKAFAKVYLSGHLQVKDFDVTNYEPKFDKVTDNSNVYLWGKDYKVLTCFNAEYLVDVLQEMAKLRIPGARQMYNEFVLLNGFPKDFLEMRNEMKRVIYRYTTPTKKLRVVK